MLDSDLADLYEVPTFRLNEAVKRKIARFPSNFMFQLTKDEYEFLTSQFAISKSGRGGRRTLPYVFTEQGVAMLSSVLNSERAIQINIQIMNTFVQMRQWAVENKDLARRVSELENYFISLNVPDGCAARTVELLAGAGVKMTSAGSCFPYGKDPRDRNIRIAPTYPSMAELEQATKLICLCVKLAASEKA